MSSEMTSVFNRDFGVDKENIQSYHNFANPKQNTKRAFGKILVNNENMQQPLFDQISQKHSKKDISEKPMQKQSTVNPQLVESYQDHIFDYVKQRLSLYHIDKHYMQKQKDINTKMRAILIDWLIDVNLKFKLLPQSLFMTMDIINRYLSIKQVSRIELQLLGIAALMIVGKYEEIYPPVLKDYVAVCDNAYKREDILRMEAEIIATLKFDLTQPCSFYFLQLIQQKLKIEPQPLVFVQYILESVLVDLESLKYDSLTIVAGAIFLVNKIFKRGRWTYEYSDACKVNEQDAKACAKDLYCMLHQVDSLGLTAIKRKFSTPVYFEVSRFKVEKVNSGRIN